MNVDDELNDVTVCDQSFSGETVYMYLDGQRGPWSWMTTDLTAVLIGPLFVIELQLFGSATMVVPYRLYLLSCGLV